MTEPTGPPAPKIPITVDKTSRPQGPRPWPPSRPAPNDRSGIPAPTPPSRPSPTRDWFRPDPRSTSRDSATSARTKTFRPTPADVPAVPGLVLQKLLANAAGMPLARLEELPVDVTHGIQRAWNRGYAVGESMGRHQERRLREAAVIIASLGGVLVGILIMRYVG